ncbi:hypothetical protein T06_10486 [Trichinella sp. T6]|nr:hypothetical protein T06_10486 [Trichinella sp. T6]
MPSNTFEEEFCKLSLNSTAVSESSRASELFSINELEICDKFHKLTRRKSFSQQSELSISSRSISSVSSAGILTVDKEYSGLLANVETAHQKLSQLAEKQAALGKQAKHLEKCTYQYANLLSAARAASEISAPVGKFPPPPSSSSSKVSSVEAIRDVRMNRNAFLTEIAYTEADFPTPVLKDVARPQLLFNNDGANLLPEATPLEEDLVSTSSSTRSSLRVSLRLNESQQANLDALKASFRSVSKRISGFSQHDKEKISPSNSSSKRTHSVTPIKNIGKMYTKDARQSSIFDFHADKEVDKHSHVQNWVSRQNATKSASFHSLNASITIEPQQQQLKHQDVTVDKKTKNGMEGKCDIVMQNNFPQKSKVALFPCNLSPIPHVQKSVVKKKQRSLAEQKNVLFNSFQALVHNDPNDKLNESSQRSASVKSSQKTEMCFIDECVERELPDVKVVSNFSVKQRKSVTPKNDHTVASIRFPSKLPFLPCKTSNSHSYYANVQELLQTIKLNAPSLYQSCIRSKIPLEKEKFIPKFVEHLKEKIDSLCSEICADLRVFDKIEEELSDCVDEDRRQELIVRRAQFAKSIANTDAEIRFMRNHLEKLEKDCNGKKEFRSRSVSPLHSKEYLLNHIYQPTVSSLNKARPLHHSAYRPRGNACQTRDTLRDIKAIQDIIKGKFNCC